MTLVPWSPEGISAPIELLAVKLPPGPVTEGQWWEALSDRVSELAVEAGDEALPAMARALGLPEPETPEGAGEAWVLGNLNLRTHLALATDGQEWPATVKASEEALQALKETDLAMWVDLASSMVSASSLD